MPSDSFIEDELERALLPYKDKVSAEELEFMRQALRERAKEEPLASLARRAAPKLNEETISVVQSEEDRLPAVIGRAEKKRNPAG